MSYHLLRAHSYPAAHSPSRWSDVSSPPSTSTVRSGSAEPPLIKNERPGYIREELERLSVEAVRLMMDSAYDDPLLASFSPDFKSVYNGTNAETGRDALYDHFIWLARQYPNQTTEVIDAVADVDERRGRAKVWMTVVVKGLPGDLKKEGISLFCWERKSNRWVCWKHVGMGGCFGYEERRHTYRSNTASSVPP
ncbi:Putative NTF2-like domain superfamily protein [Septoria linicola]|uniref:NTF2-like domain superfamily protein n=1 Tax=Septoria linicola TaxID=215465 RepID=A0A9Q9B052_9PEZI|nr:Putative NTF2-like domain superfamily protein [Septoria linicola]